MLGLNKLFYRIKNLSHKFVVSVLTKVYYSSRFGLALKVIIIYCGRYILNHKNDKIIITLQEFVSKAQKQGKPVFIQFPVMPWDVPLFQRPQQFALAMSELGYLVIYIVPYPIKGGFLKEIRENLYVTDQYWLLGNLSNAVVSLYLNYPYRIFDKYLTDRFFKQNRVICEYVDHIDDKIWGVSLANIMRQRFKNINNQPFELILGTSEALYQELLETFPNKKVACIPNGVDLSHYEDRKNNTSNFELPRKLEKAIKENKKIIGYFGAIAPWIWNELIAELADARPDYCILMIGPLYGDGSSIQKKDNIICTGVVSYQNLPFYAKHFDVSIIPFRLGDIAKTTSPLKLFEYFAIGKPVVVTSDLIECTKFDGVFSATNSEEFIKKVDEAVEYFDKIGLQQKYRRYAEENSWIMRAKELTQKISTRSVMEDNMDSL